MKKGTSRRREKDMKRGIKKRMREKDDEKQSWSSCSEQEVGPVLSQPSTEINFG
jgi:hypothetical protein